MLELGLCQRWTSDEDGRFFCKLRSGAGGETWVVCRTRVEGGTRVGCWAGVEGVCCVLVQLVVLQNG